MATVASLDTERAAALFHTLSDETRLDVVALLLHGERCVCELMDELDVAQSRLSWHPKTLADAGVISSRKEGAGTTTPSTPMPSPKRARFSIPSSPVRVA